MMQPGLYEVYVGKELWEAVPDFREKHGYLPDDVQRKDDIVVAGPVYDAALADMEDE